jgi:hypothetical protein
MAIHRTFWKPEKAEKQPRRSTIARKKAKAKEDRAFATARKKCREHVYARDGRRCRACGKIPRGGFEWLEVHEEPPRSRGGDPLNPACCLLLCNPNGCHDQRTRGTGENKLAIIILDLECGTAAPVRFEQGAKVWVG